MDLVVLCVVLVVLTAFVAVPLYRQPKAPAPAISPEEARRQAVEAALRDLEVDRESGLVDEQTYEAERARFRRDD